MQSYQLPKLDKQSSYMKNTGKNVAQNIIKINDSHIRTFISRSELESYNLTFYDFIYKRRKAFDFIIDILEQSFFECGFYKIPDNTRYSISTNIKSNNGIFINIITKTNIDFPEDTIITMADWESIYELTFEEISMTNEFNK